MATTNFESQNASKLIVDAPVASELSSKGENTPSQIIVHIAAKELQSLRYEISQLRKENQYLNRLLNPSSTFSLFPQLPREIRIPIWEFAFRTPQIHLIIQNRGGRSTINNVMQSCKEAREHCLQMKLP
jgi:hypothetical protein